jgi:hypothetical protein
MPFRQFPDFPPTFPKSYWLPPQPCLLVYNLSNYSCKRHRSKRYWSLFAPI